MTVTVGPVITTFDAPGLKDFIKDLGTLSTALGKLPKSVSISIGSSGTGGGLGNLGNVLKNLDAPLRNISAGLNQMGNGLTRVGQIAATAAYRLEILVAPLQALIVGTGKAAIQLDDQLRQVATQLDVTGAQAGDFVAKYADGMNKIAVATGQSSKEIAKGMYFIVSSMDATEQQAFAMLEPIAKFTTATRADVVDTTKAVTSAFTVFGKELAVYGDTQAQTNQILAEFFQTVRVGRAEISDIVTGFGRVAEAGKLAGSNMEEVLALLATMSRVFTPAQATTSLENFFAAFTKQSKDAAEAFQELGITTGGRNAVEVFVELMERLAKLPPVGQTDIIGRIFPNLRGRRGALSIADLQIMKDVLAQAQKLADPALVKELERAWGIMLDAPQTALSRLSEAVKAIGGDVFRGEQSGFNRFINGLTSLIEKVREGGPQAIEFFTKIALTLSALPPIFLAVSTATITLGIGLQTLATLISPTGLLIAAGAWAVFGKSIGDIVPAVREAVSDGGLGGLARMLINLGNELGILSDSQAFDLLSTFGLSLERLDTEKFRNLVSAFQDLKATLLDMKDTATAVFKEFGEFLDKVSNREGMVGGAIGELEKMGKALKDISVAVGTPIDVNWFDLITAFVGLAAVGPTLIRIFGAAAVAAGAVAGIPAGVVALLAAVGTGQFLTKRAIDKALTDWGYDKFGYKIDEFFGTTPKASPYLPLVTQGGTQKSVSFGPTGYFTPVPPASQLTTLGLKPFSTVGWPGTSQTTGLGGAASGTTGGGTSAADEARSQMESAVRSVLRPTNTGAPDPYDLLDRLGKHVDTPDEAARRLASVMVEGFGSDWVEFIKNMGILPPEAFQSDIALREAAARAYGDFQKGLLPQLYDIDIATQRAKEIFIGQRNMDALVERIMGEFQGLVTGYGPIAGPTIQVGFEAVDPKFDPLLNAIVTGEPLTNIPSDQYSTQLPSGKSSGLFSPVPHIWGFTSTAGNFGGSAAGNMPKPARLYPSTIPGLTDPFLGGATGAFQGAGIPPEALGPQRVSLPEIIKRLVVGVGGDLIQNIVKPLVLTGGLGAMARVLPLSGGGFGSITTPEIEGGTGTGLTEQQRWFRQKRVEQAGRNSRMWMGDYDTRRLLGDMPSASIPQGISGETLDILSNALSAAGVIGPMQRNKPTWAGGPTSPIWPTGPTSPAWTVRQILENAPQMGQGGVPLTPEQIDQLQNPVKPIPGSYFLQGDEKEFIRFEESTRQTLKEIWDEWYERARKALSELRDIVLPKDVQIKLSLSSETPQPLKDIFEGKMRTLPIIIQYPPGAIPSGVPQEIPKAAGGYAWQDSVYRLGESGREYVLNNRLTQMLESRVGGMLSNGNVGRAMGGGTVINVGNISLPGVTNSQQFVRELTKKVLGNIEEALA